MENKFETLSYNELIDSHLKYGTTKEDIINNNEYSNILPNVVIAPWWRHSMFDKSNVKVEKINDKLYNISMDDISFSYIELRSIGAPVILDSLLALGVTKAKNILFIGSTGSLSQDINIGDLVIPEYSINGVGATRYLNKDMKDDFFANFYPNQELTTKLLNIVKKYKEVKNHYVPNYSVDNIFAQFAHIDEIISIGAKTIEMETSTVFKCEEILSQKITALFCVSDSTVKNKSLYSGRTEEEQLYRHKVREEIMPKIIYDLFKNE